MKKLFVSIAIMMLTGCEMLEEEYLDEDGFKIDKNAVQSIEVYKDWAFELGIYQRTTLEENRFHVMVDFLNDLNFYKHSEEFDTKGSYYSVVLTFDEHTPIQIDFLDQKRGVIFINKETYVLLENDLTFIKTIEFDPIVMEDENLVSLYDYLDISEDYLYTQITRWDMGEGFFIYRIPNLFKTTCNKQVEFFIDDHFYSGVKGCEANFEAFDFYAAKEGKVYDLRELIENNLVSQKDFHINIYTKYLFEDH